MSCWSRSNHWCASIKGKSRTEARTEAHPTVTMVWRGCTKMDFDNSFQLQGRGYRAEARIEAHPTLTPIWRGRLKSTWSVKDGFSRLTEATWTGVEKSLHLRQVMTFFLILLLVCVVEDGIKVALFFHRVSLQHLTLVLLNFSCQVLGMCLKTIWFNQHDEVWQLLSSDKCQCPNMSCQCFVM